MSRKERTDDAVSILHRRYIGDDPAKAALLEEERLHAKVARNIYELRTKAGLSQRELADRIGTTQSAISRLEDADYQGHSLSMLRRVAEALGADVDVGFVGPSQTIEPMVFRRLMNLLRRSKRLDLDRLAEEIDVDRGELAAIEQIEGHRPSARTVSKLAQFYGLTPRKLATLAGGVDTAIDEVHEPALRFAAQSQDFSKLSAEERKALDDLVRALQETGARPDGDRQRKGAVRGRAQTYDPKTGHWTKRDTATGRFIDQKADERPYKRVRKEK